MGTKRRAAGRLAHGSVVLSPAEIGCGERQGFLERSFDYLVLAKWHPFAMHDTIMENTEDRAKLLELQFMAIRKLKNILEGTSV